MPAYTISHCALLYGYPPTIQLRINLTGLHETPLSAALYSNLIEKGATVTELSMLLDDTLLFVRFGLFAWGETHVLLHAPEPSASKEGIVCPCVPCLLRQTPP